MERRAAVASASTDNTATTERGPPQHVGTCAQKAHSGPSWLDGRDRARPFKTFMALQVALQHAQHAHKLRQKGLTTPVLTAAVTAFLAQPKHSGAAANERLAPELPAAQSCRAG